MRTSTLIEFLRKYNGALTINELVETIEKEQREKQSEEETKFNLIKKLYKNSYLKRYDEDSIYGGTLEIYHIEEIVSKEKTVEWNDLYNVIGTKITFSKKNINLNRIEDVFHHRRFNESQLEKMERISLQDYNDYLNQYNTLQQTLTNIK